MLPDALRSNNIDALRFFLAALVIFAHCYALPVGGDHTEPLFIFSGGQRTMGGIAVDLFFILSGFLITHSWLRSRGFLDFMWRRALRIYPAFIAASIFGVFIIAPLFNGLGAEFIKSVSPGGFLFSLITLRGGGYVGGFPNNPIQSINGSLWSIPYEFWCYFGVAALGLLTILAKRPSLMLPILVLAVAGSFYYEFKGLKLGGSYLGALVGSITLWARLLPCFLAGSVFYLFRHRIPWHPGLLVLAVLALIASCKIPHAMSVVSPLAGTYILFSVAFLPALKLQRFGKYGDFSYGLYVYAFPIQQALVAVMGNDVGVLKLFIPSFLLTLLAGIISWYAIEAPFMKLKKLGQPKPPAQPHAA